MFTKNSRNGQIRQPSTFSAKMRQKLLFTSASPRCTIRFGGFPISHPLAPSPPGAASFCLWPRRPCISPPGVLYCPRYFNFAPTGGREVLLERTQVQIPAAQLDRQRDFEAKLKEMHAARPLRALVDTFGCQQNVADSQYIMGMLRAMGCSFTDDPAQADVVVLNTCAIRDHAEKRVYGNLGALTHTKKANPAQVLIILLFRVHR